VSARNWQEIANAERSALAVVHPAGGFTVSLPPADGSTLRLYVGRYWDMRTAREAASEATRQRLNTSETGLAFAPGSVISHRA